ncbi:hypothetical protein GN956_G7798 [Arapaima gigas]
MSRRSPEELPVYRGYLALLQKPSAIWSRASRDQQQRGNGACTMGLSPLFGPHCVPSRNKLLEGQGSATWGAVGRSGNKHRDTHRNADAHSAGGHAQSSGEHGSPHRLTDTAFRSSFRTCSGQEEVDWRTADSSV